MNQPFFYSLFLHIVCALSRGISFPVLNRLLLNSPLKPDFLPERKMIYVAASCMPWHVSGYTARTHELLLALQKMSASVVPITRCGYPWDRRDSIGMPEKTESEHGGILYQHIRTPNRLNAEIIFAIRAAKSIASLARKFKVSVIHAASNHFNALPALLAAKKLGLPFQYEMRGLWELSRASRYPEYENSCHYKLGLDFEKYIAKNADAVFVISEAMRRYIVSEWGIGEEKISLLPNCVDVEKIRSHKLPVSPGTIVYAGSLVRYEGLDTLISAVSILRDEGIRVNVNIVGDGDYRATWENMAKDHRLEDRIKFLGRVSPDEAREHVDKSSLVCIPRLPYKVCELVPPLKLIDAMALNKAVIVPDLPVFRDELGKEGEGWFFRAGDPLSLAQIIKEKLFNQEELHKQGIIMRNRALSKRQWKMYIPDIIKLMA